MTLEEFEAQSERGDYRTVRAYATENAEWEVLSGNVYIHAPMPAGKRLRTVLQVEPPIGFARFYWLDEVEWIE